jgi:hypothetical protein
MRDTRSLHIGFGPLVEPEWLAAELGDPALRVIE